MDHEIVSLLVNENDEERMLRHKGDLPTTKTDTNNRSANGDYEMSQNPTPSSDRAISTDPHLSCD